VAFVEYLMWKFQKTVHLLFNPPGQPSPELLAELDRAISEYQAALAVKAARDEKIKQLQQLVELGGVKGMRAKNELDQLLAADLLEQNRREITSAAKKRKAQKAVEADDGTAARERALVEEQQRLEQERIRKEEEARRKKEESRARLAARAAAFN
jgi:hypothetical protein